MTDVSAAGLEIPPVSAPAALRVGDVFGRSFSFFRAHWIPVCAITAVGYAPIALMLAAAGASTTEISGPVGNPPDDDMQAFDALALAVGTAVIAVLLAAMLLTLATVAFGAAQDVGGRGFSVGRRLSVALRRSPAILGATTLTVLFGIVALFCFIVPGIIVFCVYSVAVPACMVEGLGPIRSMSRSAFLTRGNRWRVFGILSLLYAGGGAVEQMIGSLVSLVANASVQFAVSLPFTVAVHAFSAVAIGVLYTQLRLAREGADFDHIARVFD